MILRNSAPYLVNHRCRFFTLTYPGSEYWNLGFSADSPLRDSMLHLKGFLVKNPDTVFGFGYSEYLSAKTN